VASLKLTYSEVYNQVSDYLGKGLTPAGADLTRMKSITLRAYRKFLYPINPATGKHHLWSFLHYPTVLTTIAGQYIYEFPDDFSSLIVSFTSTDTQTYINPIPKSVWQILNMHTIATTVTTSYPQFYAIRAGRYIKEIGQKYEVVFWPEPDSNYIYEYTYEIEPPALSATTDYFVGGARASEAILQLALAEAELQEEEKGGVQYQEAQRIVMAMISADNRNTPKSVGYNGDPSMYPETRGYTHISEVTYTTD